MPRVFVAEGLRDCERVAVSAEDPGPVTGPAAECGQPGLSHEMADVEGSPDGGPPESHGTFKERTGAYAPATRLIAGIFREAGSGKYVRASGFLVVDSQTEVELMAFVKERNIEQAWRMSLWACARYGYSYKIEKGSYEGQIRKQLDQLTVMVEEPKTRPLAVTLPESSGIPAPTSEEKIQSYFYEYLATDTKEDKEDYTYGQFMAPQIPEVIKLLNSSGGATNQACMSIGDRESINLSDPPCLRVVDFKVVQGKLNMSLFFRSWDIFVGFPENLGGLQLLKEYILMHLNFPIEDGAIIAYASGAHIYEQYFPIVNNLNIHQC